MIIRLTEQLDVPLRERNTLLLAAGYAPAYAAARTGRARARAAYEPRCARCLTGHEPYPAVVINRWWEMLDGNSGASLLVDGCASWLLEPPVNVLRLSLHPDGLAPRIVNLAEWRAHLLTQLQHRARALGDDRLMDLHRELTGYPVGLTAMATPHRAWRASCCRCVTGTATRSSRSSRSAPASAPRPTSPSRSWLSRRSTRPTQLRRPRSKRGRPAYVAAAGRVASS